MSHCRQGLVAEAQRLLHYARALWAVTWLAQEPTSRTLRRIEMACPYTGWILCGISEITTKF